MTIGSFVACRKRDEPQVVEPIEVVRHRDRERAAARHFDEVLKEISELANQKTGA